MLKNQLQLSYLPPPPLAAAAAPVSVSSLSSLPGPLRNTKQRPPTSWSPSIRSTIPSPLRNTNKQRPPSWSPPSIRNTIDLSYDPLSYSSSLLVGTWSLVDHNVKVHDGESHFIHYLIYNNKNNNYYFLKLGCG